MKGRYRGALWAIATAAVLSTGAAHATSRSTPVPVARRPLTLPNATFRLDDGPVWPLPSGMAETTFFDDDRDPVTVLNLGIGFGITRNFELGAHLLKWQVDPGDDLADPSVYLLYRFLDGDFELGIFGEVSVPLDRDPVVTAGLPLALHIGDRVRLDSGAFIVHDFEADRDPDLVVPFQLPINVTRQVYLGPEVALWFYEFERRDTTFGFFAGYTFTSGGAALGDIGGRVRVPSADVAFDVVQAMLELDLYFDL